jgi:L-lactate dehydrogenase
LINGYLKETDVCLSLPATIGRKGITRVFQPNLSEEEVKAFKYSAQVIRDIVQKVNP